MKSNTVAKRAIVSDTTVAPSLSSPPPPSPSAPLLRAERRRSLEPLYSFFALIGLGFMAPLVRLCRGELPRTQLRALWQALGVPLIAIAVFVFLWSRFAA